MQKALLAVLAAATLTAPVFGGALTLQASDPAGNAEALAKHAVVIARITACHSPEKTTVTATAEGIVGGKRQSIPLKVMYLSTPGTFAVAREWPKEGAWAVQMIATNPDYKDYATAVIVPLRHEAIEWASVKHVYHAPVAADIDPLLAQNNF